MARRDHRGRQFIILAVTLVVAFAIDVRADLQPQIATVVLQPKTLTATGCAMIETDGTSTHSYTTVAAQGGVFIFDDPVPPGAIVNDIAVYFDTLATCLPSNSIQVNLNPNTPGVQPYETLIGRFGSMGSTTVCASAHFSEIAIGPLSLLIPAIAPYVRGGPNILQVSEVGSGCADVRIDKVRIDVSYYTNAPAIVFDLSATSDIKQRSILMHKFRADDDYISDAQKAVQPTSLWQRDNHVLIRGQALNPDGTPFANQTIYLRPIDPPDPAPYVPAGLSHRDDNTLGDVHGFIDVLPYYNVWLWPITTDRAGRFSATLAMEPFWAGDNEQVEASAIPLRYPISQDRCGPGIGCYTSGVLTSWRRIYIEYDTMFASGSFLRADVSPGDDHISVYHAGPFANASRKNPISVTFIHSGLLAGGVPYAQTRNVIGVSGGRRRPVLHLDAALTLPFYAALSVTLSAQGQQPLPAGDAVGVDLAGVFPLSFGGAKDLFETMFTDIYILGLSQNDSPFVPSIPQCDSANYCGEVASLWLDNSFAGSSRYDVADNHVHVVGANDIAGGGSAGITLLHDNPLPYPWAPVVLVFDGAVLTGINTPGSPFAGDTFDTAIQQVTAHELVHTFDVNQPARLTSGHCTSFGYQGGACLMNTNRTAAERNHPYLPLHNTPWETSEYRRVRRRLDPVPTAFQYDFQPNY